MAANHLRLRNALCVLLPHEEIIFFKKLLATESAEALNVIVDRLTRDWSCLGLQDATENHDDETSWRPRT